MSSPFATTRWTPEEEKYGRKQGFKGRQKSNFSISKVKRKPVMAFVRGQKTRHSHFTVITKYSRFRPKSLRLRVMDRFSFCNWFDLVLFEK